MFCSSRFCSSSNISEGATLRAVARRDGAVILSVERLMFASRPLLEKTKFDNRARLFSYISGGFELNGGRV